MEGVSPSGGEIFIPDAKKMSRVCGHRKKEKTAVELAILVMSAKPDSIPPTPTVSVVPIVRQNGQFESVSSPTGSSSPS